MHNVMLDLETMGSGPRAAIVTIGAVFFDPMTGELGEEFEAAIDLRSSAKYGEIDPKKEMPFEGVRHSALADAKHQARYVSAIYRQLAECAAKTGED